MHALSNTLGRNTRHSPPTSPLLNRRGPNHIHTAQESVYATHAAAVACTTTHNVNGNLATHTNITLTSIDPVLAATTTTATTTTNTRAAPPSMVKQQPVRASASSSNVTASSASSLASSSTTSTVSVNNSGVKVLMKARSDEEQKAPPLPPRKAGDKKSSSSSLANHSANSSNATSMLNLSSSSGNSSVCSSRSTENITTLSDFEVPKTTAPPVPKHRTAMIDTLAYDFQTTFVTPSTYNDEDYEVEAIIVGPAETISGIIDTRPLEARKPICSSEIEKNNLYQLKTSQTSSPSMHVRHQSLPVNNASINHNQRSIIKPVEASVVEENHTSPSPVKHRIKSTHVNEQQSSATTLPTTTIAPTTTQTPPANSTVTTATSTVTSVSFSPDSTASLQHQSTGGSSVTVNQANQILPTRPTSTPPQTNFVYENMTINSVKDCNNVPYENINLEYIARLMNEGYSKEHVITALGISRNNIEVAYDMLHVFVKKSGGSNG